MLKGGVIMDVMNVEQARIAEEAGAISVMALERVPAMIRAEAGGRGLGCVLVEVQDHDARAMFREQPGGRHSDPARSRRTGDDRNLSLEQHWAILVSWSGLPPGGGPG